MADVSDQAVAEKTGKTRRQWVEIIDGFGGEKMTHKQIAHKLRDDKLIASGWWRQQITVDYERAKGRRVKGQTAGAGFEVGVSKTVPVTAAEAWELLVSERGLKVWLGDISVDDIRFDKGASYTTKDGVTGQIRSVYPGEKLRLTWRPPNRAEPATLQIYLEAKENKTVVGFHQEKLSGPSEREQMRKHWQTVLVSLSELA